MKLQITISDKCKDCVYYEDALKILNGTGVIWSSSQPHPCMICINLKQEQIEKPDNFIRK